MQSHFIFNVPRTNSSDDGLNEGLSFLFGSFSPVSIVINYNIEGKKAKRPSYLNACLFAKHPSTHSLLFNCSPNSWPYHFSSWLLFLLFLISSSIRGTLPPPLGSLQGTATAPIPTLSSSLKDRGRDHHTTFQSQATRSPGSSSHHSFCHHCRHEQRLYLYVRTS